LRREVEIAPDETTPELAARMSAMGADLIADTLTQFDRGEISPTPQDGKSATYAPILKKENGRIDWARPAQQIYNSMRGFTPWPGAYTTFRGQTCQIWGRPEATSATEPHATPGQIIQTGKEIRVLCGESTLLRLDSVQIEGRKKLASREFANGARIAPEDRFA
jgi:methionyl-tRNA formyltransferase